MKRFGLILVLSGLCVFMWYGARGRRAERDAVKRAGQEAIDRIRRENLLARANGVAGRGTTAAPAPIVSPLKQTSPLTIFLEVAPGVTLRLNGSGDSVAAEWARKSLTDHPLPIAEPALRIESARESSVFPGFGLVTVENGPALVCQPLAACQGDFAQAHMALVDKPSADQLVIARVGEIFVKAGAKTPSPPVTVTSSVVLLSQE